MNKRISSNIKTIGFFMTCAMVFYHVGSLDSSLAVSVFDANINSFFNYLFDKLGYLAMSHFFTVTGFLLFHDDYCIKKYPIKIKRRIGTLLVPYVCWQIITVAIDVMQKQYSFSFAGFINRTFLLAKWPQDGALWYVYAVFLMALISPVLFPIFRNRKIGWVAIIVISVAVYARDSISNSFVKAIVNYGYISNVLSYLPCYLIGCFCGKFYSNCVNEEKETQSLHALSLVLSMIIVSFVLEGVFKGFFSWTVMETIPIMVILSMPSIKGLEERKIYNVTFLIYAIHQPLIRDLKPLTNIIYKMNSISVSLANLTARIIVLTVDIGLSICISILLKKIYPKGLVYLTGGRTK